MTTRTQPMALDPYDYAFQEDPYPVYARLREPTSRCTTTRSSTCGR